MSLKALSIVYEATGLTPMEKLVSLALANHQDQDGRCWPSHEVLKTRCCTSKSTIIRTLKSLEKKGLVHVQRRIIDNLKAPNVYRLQLHLYVSNCNNETSSSVRETSEVVSERHMEPPLEPPKSSPLCVSPQGESANDQDGHGPERDFLDAKRGDASPGGAVQREPAPPVGRVSKKSRYPSDFRLSQPDIDFAEVKGVDWREEFEHFRDHYRDGKGAGTTMADWRAGWRNWCRKSVQFAGNGKSRSPAGYQPRTSHAQDAFREIRAGIAAANGAGRTDEGAGGFVVFDRPHERAERERQTDLADVCPEIIDVPGGHRKGDPERLDKWCEGRLREGQVVAAMGRNRA